MAAAETIPPPVFILGISQRSGTNFLFNLLCQHPDCGIPGRRWEDFALAKSDDLVRYVQTLSSIWKRWDAEPEVEDLLYEQLGSGLISVMARQVTPKRMVTKTPSVCNLEYFFTLFPHAYLILLVRDGRDVVESRVKTFHESYEVAMRKWAEGADTILRFDDRWRDAKLNYLIVRYEDVFSQTQSELTKIMAFCGLDAAKYDFEAALNLPVRGSSVHRGEGQTDVNWKPVAKSADFNPIGRASRWRPAIRQRFQWIAGQQQTRFGYQTESQSGDSPWSDAWNRALDVKWRVRGLWEFPLGICKRILKAIFGAERMSKLRHHWIQRRRNRLEKPA